jgi:glycosyltransferase involved in cell wall biosynthesis
MKLNKPRLILLSNVYDFHYVNLRRETVPACLSSPKRRDLFQSLHLATNRDLLILSSPPKSLTRRSPKWLPAVCTSFAGFSQLFCRNLDAPKIRIPFSWFFYALHVLRHVRRGDVLIIDNFELIYVIAAWLCRVVHGNQILLDFEDGKHLTDHGWSRCLSAPAEFFGKPLIQGAILAHPSLGERLSPKIPKILVPGFYIPPKKRQTPSITHADTRFVYAGSLDAPRGVDLLLDTIQLLPETGWQLDITGSGPLESRVRLIATHPSFKRRVVFHSVLDAKAHSCLLAESNVGLNLQRSSNPISQVTFPSKIFSYLSAGLLVISSRASEVEAILKKACLYLTQETPEALAALMCSLIPNKEKGGGLPALERFTVSSTSSRLRSFLQQVTPSFL